MNSFANFLWVGLGGGIGAVLRFVFSSIGKETAFPYQTMLINITGSFFIGLILALTEKSGFISDPVKLFLVTGICGGFTTFSAFSFENMQLMRSGNFLTAGLYILISVACCITATFIGYKLINN